MSDIEAEAFLAAHRARALADKESEEAKARYVNAHQAFVEAEKALLARVGQNIRRKVWVVDGVAILADYSPYSVSVIEVES